MDPVPQIKTGNLPGKAPAKVSARFISYLILAAILLTLSVCALSAVFIRSIDSILAYAGQDQFADIFSQLEDADLDPHGVIPFVLALCFLLVIGLLVKKIGRWAVIPSVLLGIVLFVLSFAAAVWFTDVNGIRFGTVMLSLVDMIEAGAF
ncbi:MAG: hypothetical protein IJ497_05790 [Clostridia bacterium]|nr:hypothetical protein [Clostridia bacterium]